MTNELHIGHTIGAQCTGDCRELHGPVGPPADSRPDPNGWLLEYDGPPELVWRNRGRVLILDPDRADHYQALLELSPLERRVLGAYLAEVLAGLMRATDATGGA